MATARVALPQLSPHNAGDVDAFVAQYADDAVVTIEPPPPGVPGESLWLTGSAEIRGWAEGLMEASNHHMDLEITRTDGQTVIGKSTYTNDNLKALGVDTVDNHWVVTLQGGKIQGYTATMTDESLAALMAAME